MDFSSSFTSLFNDDSDCDEIPHVVECSHFNSRNDDDEVKSDSDDSEHPNNNDDFIEESPQVERREDSENKYLSSYLDLLEDENDEDADESEHQQHPARTIFDFLDSDKMFESEKNDVNLQNEFENIHRAVKETILSLPIRGLRRSGAADVGDAPNPYRPPELPAAHPPKTHRKAHDMKGFAINLNPHTFMVCHRDRSKTILT
jgi:hypothetical protein